MSPPEALQSAPRGPAEFFGRLAMDGTMEAGKTANLVILDADPLLDNANTRRVAAVGRGKIVPDVDRAQGD